MIRVGFVFAFRDQSWLGGVHYCRNLLSAVLGLADRNIEPVILTGFEADPGLLKDLPPVTVIRSSLFDRWRSGWFLRKALSQVAGFDLALEYLCRKHRIAVLSHSGYLRPGSPVRTLGWISDFQHKRLPHLFGAREISRRDRAFARICRHCDGLVVSSRAALADLGQFFPGYESKARVLRFAVVPPEPPPGLSLESLLRRHSLPDRFFHLPNQFWIHKNHEVVVDALGILRRRGQGLTVVATGNTRDQRWPRYFQDLLKRIKSAGAEEHFRILGVLPYPEVRLLMEHAVAVINPSLFEGWSTTVEEAKALGKQVLLSSIPVHLEQAPERGHYFDPGDASALADLLLETAEQFDTCAEHASRKQVAAAAEGRMQEFGMAYQEVLMEILR